MLKARRRSEGKSRAALDAATWRLVLSLSHVRRLEQALSDDEAAQAAIGDVDLAAFIPKRRYGPRALAPHVSLDSPVLIRRAPGARDDGRRGDRAIAWRRRHGNWVLLTIAVVMRAGYG